MADLLNTFGGFTSVFGLFGGILASLFSDFFYKQKVFNRIFQFVENKKESKHPKQKEMDDKSHEYNTVYLRKMDVTQIKNYFASNAETILANKKSIKAKKNLIQNDKNSEENKIWNMVSKQEVQTKKNQNIPEDEEKIVKDIELSNIVNKEKDLNVLIKITFFIFKFNLELQKFKSK